MERKTAAASIAAMAPVASVPSAVAAALRDSTGPLHVACSGGADSVFALLLLVGWRATGAIERSLIALHFDHALRGEESAADALFVGDLCADLGVPLKRGQAAWSDPSHSVSEDAARRARLRFFAEAAVGADAPADIVTGHHADDVVETMLMRLARGSGLQGLTAPRSVSLAPGGLRFLRPLLDWSRERIRQTLTDLGVAWREDSTNELAGYHRNRIRLNVLPLWEAASDRPVRPGVARSRRLLEEDWEALEAWIEGLWGSMASSEAGAPSLNQSKLAAAPRAAQRRLLARLGAASGVDSISATAMERMLTALVVGGDFAIEIAPGARIVGNGAFVSVRRSIVRSYAPWEPFRLPFGSVAFLPDGARIEAKRIQIDAAAWALLREGGCDNGRCALVSIEEKHCSSVSVRQRRTGDAFIPHGKSSPKKLKDLLIERKIPAQQRGRLPVFCVGSEEIAWMPGLPPAAKLVLPGPTPHALRLTYEQ